MTTTRAPAPGPAAGPPRLSLREPTDVLAAIPYLIGFHPTDCVVVLALHGRRMAFAARGDLPETGESVRGVVGHLASMVARHQATGAAVVGYGVAARVDPVVLGLHKALERRDISVLEVMRAADGRYWSHLCDDNACCPPEGSPYDLTSSPVAAAAIVAGLAVLPSRQAYEDQLRPVEGPERLAMVQATERAHDRLIGLISQPPDERGAEAALVDAGQDALAAAFDRICEGGRLDDDEAAWLSVLVSSEPVLESAWRLVNAGPDLGLHRVLWTDVFRRAEPDLMSAPGCLLAYSAWRGGDASLACIALERVLATDPLHEPTNGLAEVIGGGAPPSIMDLREGSRVRPRLGRRARTRSSSRRAGSRRG